jgi:phosphoribosylamine-glycine ligase
MVTICKYFMALAACTQDGRAKLLEHNVRFGDPECQTLMARTQGDFTEALLQV